MFLSNSQALDSESFKPKLSPEVGIWQVDEVWLIRFVQFLITNVLDPKFRAFQAQN